MDFCKFVEGVDKMNVDQLLLEIESINGSLPGLTGMTKVMARQDQDHLVEQLATITGSWWRNARLTIMDSNAQFHNEGIVFRDADGLIVDETFDGHVLVMPKGARFTEKDIIKNFDVVKLDHSVDWMPIKNFLIVKIDDHLHLIHDLYGIRAFSI